MEDLITDISDARHVIIDFMHMKADERAGYEKMFQLINQYLKSHAPPSSASLSPSSSASLPRPLRSPSSASLPRPLRSPSSASLPLVHSAASSASLPLAHGSISPGDSSMENLASDSPLREESPPPVTMINPTFHHLLHHDLGILCDDFLTALHDFETDAKTHGRMVLGVLQQLLKHFSWHDLNVVMMILSDICTIISTVSLPIYPPLSPIFAVVAAVAGGLSKVNYQQLYLQFLMVCRWLESLIDELDRYLKVHYGPVIKRLFYTVTKV